MLTDSLKKMEEFVANDRSLGAKQVEQTMQSTFTAVSNIMSQEEVR